MTILSYEDIAERMALIAQLAYPLTCTPDDNSVIASYIQELAQFTKTPGEVKEELGPEWLGEETDDEE